MIDELNQEKRFAQIVIACFGPGAQYHAMKAFLVALSLMASSAAAQTAVVTRNVNLRTGPSSSRSIVRQLAPPDELAILDPQQTNGYWEVRVAGGDQGWVWSRNVRVTGAAPAANPAGPLEEYRTCGMEGSAQQANRQASNRRKNRVTGPQGANIDPSLTIDSLVRRRDDHQRWSDTRAVSIVAFVVDVKKGGEETVNCGETDLRYRDTHIDIVMDPNQTSKILRMIVEVTPRWRAFMNQQGTDWSTPTLKQRLQGHWVRFTGWLFWDFEHADEAENSNPGGDRNWRATAWEIHPVTEIRVCPGSPQTC
jgi:uncharacterized protein YgiM (DUF1202 family)